MLPRDTTIATFQSGQPVLASLADVGEAIGLPTAQQIQFISSAASSAIDRIEALGDDGIISIDEKKKRLPALERELESLWAMLAQRAGELPTDGDVSSTLELARASRAAWLDYRDELVPPLNQTDVDTPVDRVVFDARLEDYRIALARLSDALRIAASRTSTWSGTADDDGNRPEDGATVGAPTGTPVGDRPAEMLVAQVDQMHVDLGALVEIYGDTVSAAASADAAAAYAAAAQTARNDAQAAATAAGGARDAAIVQATAAGGSASAAAGSATIASTKADQAAGSATAAQGSATAANSSAGAASVSAGQAATSATNAAGSATSAATSASTAATARDGAQTAQGLAAGSASAAASSASSAAASQSAAAGSASSASTSATTATTKAAEAGTSAGQASTSATNAAGSASSAATNAGVAAAARDSARLASQATVPGNFTDPYNWARDGSWGGNAAISGGLMRTTNGGAFYGTFLMPLAAGATLRLTCRFRVINQGGGYTYLGVYAVNSAGDFLGVVWSAYAGAPSPALNTWTTPKVDMTAASILAAYPTAAFVSPVGLFGYVNTSDAEVSQLQLEDVTSENAAAGSASAAASSASSASASQSAAGASATSASNSANTATVQAGNSSANASAAAGSAAAASSSAASALQNMRLAASVGARSALDNSTFADWPASSFATSWANWGGIAASKTTGLWPNPNAVLCDSTPGAGSCGVYQTVASIRPGRYVAEVDIEVLSGTINGIGCLWRGFDGATTFSALDNALWQLPDIGGITRGAGAGVGIYRWAVPFELIPGTVSGTIYVVCDGHWSNIAKKVKIHRVVLRPADSIDLLPATVSTLAGVVADMQGRQSGFLQLETAVAGSEAATFLTMRSDVSVPAAAPLTPLLSTARMVVSGGGRSFYKTADDANWGDGFISNEAYTGGAWVQANAMSTLGHKMIGLTDQNNLNALNYYFSYLNYAMYGQWGGVLEIREGGTGYWTGLSYDPNKPMGVQYTPDNGGTISYWYGGVELTDWRRTNVGAARTFRAMASLHNAGTTQGFSNVVFGPTAPSVSSSAALGAQEIIMVNQFGSLRKVALKLANGNAAFGGDIYAGGKIILGNGNTGWEIAVKPKEFQVTDGQAVTWSNLGYIPAFVFSPIGLAPLAAGETYNLYLDSLSATGATVRLKINVPGTPSSYNLTVDAAGGAGDPARVMSKAGNPDANGGQYRYQGTFSASATAERAGPGQWYAYIDWTVSLYAKVGGTWTLVNSFDGTFIYGDSTGGVKTYNGSYDVTITAPAGVTDFGATGTDLASVSWTSPGAGSSVRTATPNGQTCPLTIKP
ncbi:hypothetical protein OMP43_17440 [Sphingomonas sp. CBMAI 2297]|nr:hypothetical protein [Sphingomonas sp. CBMAI 2297]